MCFNLVELDVYAIAIQGFVCNFVLFVQGDLMGRRGEER